MKVVIPFNYGIKTLFKKYNDKSQNQRCKYEHSKQFV